MLCTFPMMCLLMTMSRRMDGCPLKCYRWSGRCFGAVVDIKRARMILRSGGLVKTITRQAETGIRSPARFRVRAPSVGRLAAVRSDPALSCEASVIRCLVVQTLASCRGLDYAVSKKCQRHVPATFCPPADRASGTLLNESGASGRNATPSTARRITSDPPATSDRVVDSHPCSSSKRSIRSGARSVPWHTSCRNSAERDRP